MVSLKQYNMHSIKNISRNIKAAFFKLGIRTVHQKRSKMTPVKPCHHNSYAADPVLIKTKFPRCYPTQASSAHNNLMGRVKTKWEPCVCRARPCVPLKKIANGDILFFTVRDWSPECCHGNDIVGVIMFLL